ncbi:phosphoribosyltransferase family protein [Neobacillus drentensis]|uniref:phosphoribosyltransferase family protein n=1 Tax=Neobacillus drentensis TaxID=220684 RepID=UPI001F2D998A|nr:phosphoribosyltransferase family protein [Neobacillus drentensis]ULT55339.1 phosphoribosyltransferase family protein [Neobacillus drentensis]
MKNSQVLTLSEKRYTFNILDSIKVEINSLENPYHIPIDELFTMAARINKKRSFLFISKVLGKHLPIEPNKGLLIAALLGARYLEVVKGIKCREKDRLLSLFIKGGTFHSSPFIAEKHKPVIIGFAETATALGHAFFDCFEGAEFFHTTREEISGERPVITFEEEHSHATSHRCYIPLEMIDHQREVILVDDEITTGNTALNIIKSIHENFPRPVYTVVSILDWRSQEYKEKFLRVEQELGIKINVVSLLSGHVKIYQLKELEDRSNRAGIFRRAGSIEVMDLGSYFTSSPFSSRDQLNGLPYLNETGRFGLKSIENFLVHQRISKASEFLRQKRNGVRTLCLGTGEFMYLPMRLAAEMGSGVYYQSTTRSPIYIKDEEGYGAKFGVNFPNPENEIIPNFVYNIPPNHYDELFLFFEREVSKEKLEPMIEELGELAFKTIKIVFFSGRQR